VKPRKRSKRFADSKDLDKDFKGKHDKSLKVKNNRRSKANVNESEDESDKSGGLQLGQLAVLSKSNAYRRTLDLMKASISPQENDMNKDRKYKAGGGNNGFQAEGLQISKRQSRSLPRNLRRARRQDLHFFLKQRVQLRASRESAPRKATHSHKKHV
jgi:hypothetical protein